MKIKNKALFLDRDGVINRELDRGVKSRKEFKIIPNVGKAIARLNLNNIPCFLHVIWWCRSSRISFACV